MLSIPCIAEAEDEHRCQRREENFVQIPMGHFLTFSPLSLSSSLSLSLSLKCSLLNSILTHTRMQTNTQSRREFDEIESINGEKMFLSLTIE